ncbi:MAG: hypothetical protein H6Q03_1718 [Acidobacteria bacterium]|nr:hypothetical protein [Acidobacteriota bacterium]
MKDALDADQPRPRAGEVGLGADLVEQAIDLRVAIGDRVPALVPDRRRMEVGPEVERGVDRPAPEQCLESARAHHLAERVHLDQAWLHGDADPAQLVADQHRGFDAQPVRGVGGELEGERLAVALQEAVPVGVAEAAPGENLPRALRIVGPGRELGIARPHPGRHRPGGDARVALPERVDQRLAVDPEGQREPDLGIVEGRPPQVPGDVVELARIGDRQAEARRGLDAGGVARRQAVEEVDLAREQALDQRGRVRDDPEDDPVEPGARRPGALRVGLEHDLLAGVPRRQPERSAGHQALAKPGLRAAPALEGQRRPGMLRQDAAVVGVHDLVRIGVTETETDRPRVDDLDVLDRLLRLRVGPGDLGRALGAPGESYVLRGHRRAVAPARVGAQMEDELAAVGGELPALGERGGERGRVLGPVRLLGEQGEEELVEDLVGETDAARDQLVDAGQVHRGADRRHRRRRLARRLGSAAGVATARGQESRAERGDEPAGTKRHDDCPMLEKPGRKRKRKPRSGLPLRLVELARARGVVSGWRSSAAWTPRPWAT